MPADTLRKQLAACRPSFSFGLSPNTRRILLMTRPDEIPEALDYIDRQAPGATPTGIMPFPDCVSKDYAPAGRYALHGSDIPFLPLAAVQEHPEAAVLVFSSCVSQQFSSAHSFYPLFFHLLRETAHFFIYPEIQNDLWCTRASPDFFRNNATELEWVYSTLADAESKAAFAGAIKAVITGNIGYMRLAAFRHYQHPLTWPKAGDIIIDGGIAVPFGICSFAEAVGPSGRVYGFEPDPEAYASILADLENRPEKTRIELLPLGLFSKKSEMHILLVGNGGSRLTNQLQTSENIRPCRVTNLDSFVAERKLPRVDVIKLDIEGAEAACLQGAARTLRAYKPRLLISGYHNEFSDLIAVPRTILECEPRYALSFATSYMLLGEMVFYAY